MKVIKIVVKDANISLCMDIFGYSFFVSFVLAPLPGLLVSFLKRFNEKKASEWSLSFLIILDTLLCALGLISALLGLTLYLTIISIVPNVHRWFKSWKCNFFMLCILNCPNIFLYRKRMVLSGILSKRTFWCPVPDQ